MLKGKVALITGSVRGIGKAVSIAFAKAGAHLVLNYTSERSEAAAQTLVKEIENMGRQAIAIQADVSQFEQAQELIQTAISKYGRLDILVNNAGITKDMLLVRMTENEFDEVLAVNLKGVFNCSKVASKWMLKTIPEF